MISTSNREKALDYTMKPLNSRQIGGRTQVCQLCQVNSFGESDLHSGQLIHIFLLGFASVGDPQFLYLILYIRRRRK